METPATLGSRTPEELEERRAAVERGAPFLMFRDGDLVKIGRTILGYHQPGVGGPGPTMVQGELSATPRFSEQQQRILRALCRPLFSDGEAFNPASDLEVADETGI